MFRLSNKKALSQELKCKVLLLIPDEEIEVGYTVSSTGQDLFNEVTKELELLDKDYYGLKLHDQIQWLDFMKPVAKQTKGLTEVIFELRFKYYPAEPALLANESTRYYLYLQLRLDLIEGRLRDSSQDTYAYLIACILQSELGDYNPNPSNEDDNYVAKFKFVPNQSEDLEWAAIRLHQNEDFQGLKPADSELNFLKKACQLETYGIDPYPVKEGHSHNHFLIGVNHQGISTFQGSRRANKFTWDEIERITLDNKLVLIYCRKITNKKGEKSSKSKPLFGFRCPSQAYAHNFWKIATEHRYFFTLESTPDLPIVTNTGGLFKKSHKLKYAGRVEKDLLRDHVDESRASGVKRSHSLMSKQSSDGPRWQGFQPGKNLQSSLNNIYANEGLNKTLPANLNYFREEDEDQLEDCGSPSLQSTGGTRQGVSVFSGRPSIDGTAKESLRGTTFTRRSVLTTKSEAEAAASTGNAIRKGSQVYMDTEHQTQDFIKTSIVLVVLLVLSLLIMLLISDSDRPNSVSLLLKKMNLEPISSSLRKNWYLPLKSAVRDGISTLFSILDSARLF